MSSLNSAKDLHTILQILPFWLLLSTQENTTIIFKNYNAEKDYTAENQNSHSLKIKRLVLLAPSFVISGIL